MIPAAAAKREQSARKDTLYHYQKKNPSADFGSDLRRLLTLYFMVRRR